MSLYDHVSDLPLTIEETERVRRERDTSSDFLRATTTFVLRGEGVAGQGEDVTYDIEDHDALADAPPFDLAGEYTFEEFSRRLDDLDLFPTREPGREDFRHYRRWGLESAGLDLALRQADQSLGEAIERTYAPVRFVVSTRLGDPPTTDRVEMLLERDPDCEFKLDPVSEWTEDIVTKLAETGTVRVLDLKGRYEGIDVEQEADPDLYERVFAGFPDAVLEDPALAPETEPLVEDNADRISWDVPITGVESIEALPFEPRWLNVKPSRFGTVESLFESIEWCEERGVQCYGGGQFELGPGRGQIQALASLCYPDGPNDVAPGGYNDPEPPEGLPTSPLVPSEEPTGFGF